MKSRRQDTKTEREDKLSDSNRKLRSDVKKYQNTIKQLQKENRKLIDLLNNHGDGVDLPIEEEVKYKNPCRKCYGDTDQIAAGVFVIYICKTCGHKERKRNDKT